MLLNDQASNLTCQISWRRNNLSSWRSCQEILHFQASYAYLSPREHLWRFLCIWAVSWRPSWSSCPGLVVSGGRRAECFQPVRAAFLNKALFVFRARSLEPGKEGAEIRPVWPLWRAPASQLRPYCVCVCVCVCVSVCACHILFLNYFSLLYFFSHQAYGQHDNIVYTWSTLDLNVWATACMFSALCLLCYSMNICVMVSSFIVWNRSVTSVCACERLCGLRNHWYIIFPVCVCVSPEYLAIV